MSNVLAEGGYQAFDLSGTDTTVLVVSLVVALAALGVAYVLMRGVLATDPGGKEMTDISDAIHEGAMAYITRQFRTIAVIVVPLPRAVGDVEAARSEAAAARAQATATGRPADAAEAQRLADEVARRTAATTGQPPPRA